MIKAITISVFLLLLHCSFAIANHSIVLNFQATYHQQKLRPNDSTTLDYKGQPLKITTLKFYIGKISLLKDSRIVYQDPVSFHLLDAAIESSMQIQLSNKKNIDYNQINFTVGIDSATNVSGAMAGDLDPTKGMYWTWQSGYINFKLEGESTFCNTRHHQFEFHIGGYTSPYSPLQTILLATTPSEKNTVINIDLSRLLNSIDLKTQRNIMSPGVEAYQFSTLLKEIFSN